MALLPNQRLGPYEILSAIGAGGMGEVYRARDTRLNRIVAIKVPPAHLADKPDLRERFEREARTIASLNHPHICTLYDIGRQDGIDYLVLEYLEGEALAEHLKKGPLPLEQVLRYAIEIADALDKAHRKGVTHRDLKPGNIMLTKSGTKLLDFGLAKLRQEGVPATPFSQLPTMKDAVTAEGTILGTLQYMAPEQVEGKTNEIDARTDIFAFGVLVYEMATGQKAFEGKSQASVIAAILKDQPPPMSSLQPLTPAGMDRIVKTCLEKDPEERFQTAGDLCRELKWIAEDESKAVVPAAKSVDRRSLLRRWATISGLACLTVAAVAVVATWNLKPSPAPSQRVTRFTITLPVGDQLVNPGVAISPDGSWLAYVARRGGFSRLYLRSMSSLEARPIPGAEDTLTSTIEPFFSPDSQWVGYFANGKLRRVSLNGGVAQVLGDAPTSTGASWSSRGTIAFGPDAIGPVQAVPDSARQWRKPAACYAP